MTETMMGIFLGLAIFATWCLYLIADNVRAMRKRLDEAARKEAAR